MIGILITIIVIQAITIMRMRIKAMELSKGMKELRELIEKTLEA